jgi:hypothetical protein
VGRLAHAAVTVAQSGIAQALTPFTGAAVTVSPPAGRLLRVSFYCPMSTADVAVRTKDCTIDNGAGVRYAGERQTHAATGWSFWVDCLVPSTGAGMTFRALGSISGNTMATNVAAIQPALLLVEDVGPV